MILVFIKSFIMISCWEICEYLDRFQTLTVLALSPVEFVYPHINGIVKNKRGYVSGKIETLIRKAGKTSEKSG